MKNILLALILANILYFMWGMFVEEKPPAGVAFVAESDLGPPLDVTADHDSAAVAAALGSDDPSTTLQAVVGRSCVTIGPLTDNTDADAAVLVYRSEGMQVESRTAMGEIFIGHWVQIRNVANDAEADELLQKLKVGGLSDAYVVSTDDEGLKISLGLFGDKERAEKIELQALSLNLTPEISPRTRPGEVYYVDIGLPPGKGAGAIVEKYGQDRVLLRAAATCPK